MGETRPCPVCFAVVRVADLDDHVAWHRTLTNLPREDT